MSSAAVSARSWRAPDAASYYRTYPGTQAGVLAACQSKLGVHRRLAQATIMTSLQAASLAQELKDKRAERAVARANALALRQASSDEP